MRTELFRISDDTILTEQKLDEYIGKHNVIVSNRYKKLQDAYNGNYDIFRQAKKPSYKPDNRIAVNFAKYITDTMNGFFMGTPVKMWSDDERINEFVNFESFYNSQDDINAELSKISLIYGKAYEMYYIDEYGKICVTYLDPMESFMIYDESIIERPRYFVRMYRDTNHILRGSISDESTVRYFEKNPNLRFLNEYEKPHGFNGVPATEFRNNEECIGIFENAMSQINAYNKAISEKANDVDYFADAYMKILGAKLDDEELKSIRDDRIINFDGSSDENLTVDFLQKPNGDTTQENLIDRLEKLIFQMSMVANISDENFGASSGIALKYKLLAMSNLANTLERKFKAGMNNRYKLIFSNPISAMNRDDWVKINYEFTRNYPANETEEAQMAAQLNGIVSKKTQLSILSVVDDVNKEIDRIEEENDLDYETDYPTARNGETETTQEEQIKQTEE